MFWRKKMIEPDSEGYYQTNITAVSLTPNHAHTHTLNGHPIILTRWQEKIYSFSGLCPHASGDLTKGELRNGRIDCPDHNWRFDIATGRVLFPPDEPCRLKQYPHKQIDGYIWIKLT
jgi:nitrite reductase/ring-hydroxylating ferredoxin subunit